ncbi:GSCOCG00011845001-RA-CDS [Cotesia congregata]|nr:GSCOCG00011845001-RA-CDS [Cotesia congregata]
MSDRKGKKCSKSRSRSRERRKRHRDEKIDELENRVINLTKVVTVLVNIQKEQLASKNPQQENSLAKDNNDSPVETVTLSDEANGKIDPTTEAESSRDDILKILGFDAKDSTFKDKNKKEILQSYNRKGEFYTEAPKINLEVVPLLSEIAKKRDQHFLETQNCVGTAISALGAAVSLLLDLPKEGLDEDLFTTYISHAGQILTDVFFQQTEARKSFITPQLNKNIKPVVDSMISNEWLYGDKLKESVKDAKEIEKACADIKEKTPLKSSQKFQSSGNSKYPPATYRPVGQQQRRFMKFKPKSNKTQRTSSKTAMRSTSHSSSRK